MTKFLVGVVSNLSHRSDRGSGVVVLILQVLNLWITPREEQPQPTAPGVIADSGKPPSTS